MKNIKLILMVASFFALIVIQGALATPVIGNIDQFGGGVPGDGNPIGEVTAHDPWAATDDSGTPIAAPTEAGNHLVITTPIGDQPGIVIAFTTDSDFVGAPGYDVLSDYTIIRFNLQQGGVSASPVSLALYFKTSNGGPDREWTYDFGLNPGFGFFTANIGAYSPGWQPRNFGDDPASVFLSDIGNITEIGIRVAGAPGGDIFYLDDFEIGIMVPEPETVWMILAVALSLGMTFRGRLAELGGLVKGRFVKA